MKRIMASVILVMFFSSWASAEALVWKAQKGSAVIYLGGTFHILRESDFPLPEEYEKAYKASDVVVLETDMEELQRPATQQKMLAQAMYADGSTIDKHLSPKAYRRLGEYCAANGVPLRELSRFKPAMLMTTLTLLELMKLGVTQHGVDDYYYKQAKKDNKPIKQLESVDQQIGYLVSLADGDEDEFIEYSLKDLKVIRGEFESLETAWREGNADKLDELMNAEFKDTQPRLYKKLITDRNRNWMPLIDAGLKTGQTRFILVGAAHLVGRDGIISALKKRGYRVEKL